MVQQTRILIPVVALNSLLHLVVLLLLMFLLLNTTQTPMRSAQFVASLTRTFVIASIIVVNVPSPLILIVKVSLPNINHKLTSLIIL